MKLEKLGNPPGEIQKKTCHVVLKKIQSKVDTSCWMFVSAFQAMKLIETAQGGGGWVLLSNCPLELRYLSDAMYGNSREKTMWRADYVYKLGVNGKKTYHEVLVLSFSRKKRNDKQKQHSK